MPLIRKTAPVPVPSEKQDWRAEVARLETGSVDERWAAARALGAEPQAVPALEEALAAPEDARLREAIFTSLARLDSEASFAAVLRQLRSDDAQLRSLALDAMRLMPVQKELHLGALLRDDDPDIRVLACDLALGMPSAAALLAALLAREALVNVCAAAIEVLAEIGGAAELPALDFCAARFPDAFFLSFSARTAAERIRARAGS
jgi:HEAT repeat protein